MRANQNKFRLGATHLMLKLTDQPALRLAVPQCRAFLHALTQVAFGVGIAVIPHVVEETLRVGVSRCCKHQPRSNGQGRQRGP
jgi:hypothetical protein